MRLEFLECSNEAHSSNTAYIDTQVYPDNETGAQVTYQITKKTDYMPAGVFYSSSPRLAMYMLRNDSPGGAVGNWGNIQIWASHFGEDYTYVKKITSLNFLNDRKACITCPEFENKITSKNLTWEQEKIDLSFILFSCADRKPTTFSFFGRIFEAKMSQQHTLVLDFIPVLDPSGEPCMYDTVTGQPFRNNGTGQFIAGFTMSQAEDLGSLIPANTTLTVSFPWEASLVQHNSRVEYSLKQARDKGCTISVQYREPEKDSAIYNKYAECTTAAEIASVNPDYRTDLTEDGAWEYPLSQLKSVPALVPSSDGIDNFFFRYSPIKKIDIELPKLTTATNLLRASSIESARILAPVCSYAKSWFEWTSSFRDCYLYLPNATSIVTMFIGTKIEELTAENFVCDSVINIWGLAESAKKLRRVSIQLDYLETANNAFASCTSLTSFEADLPKLKSGAGMFNTCKLNKESALRILNTIPTWTSGTHALTIGIHIDHQNDEEVVAAITAAEEKGWTLTVQWNGTPTAQTVSTFGLRKPPIYAKLATMEHPDGTIENFLDWGHYVSNAEENGYQEFSSKEEAYEHFNLETPTEE